VLRYVGTESYGLAGLGTENFGATRTSEGKLAFSWDDPTAVGVSKPDGAAIFAVRFEIVGPLGSVSLVSFADSALVREVGVNFVEVMFDSNDGLVRVMEPAPLRLTEMAVADGAVSVAIQTTIGKHYTLEYTDDLSATTWTALPTIIGDGTLLMLRDPSPSPSKRFYRVRVNSQVLSTP
jgi:hypothetical protein